METSSSTEMWSMIVQGSIGMTRSELVDPFISKLCRLAEYTVVMPNCTRRWCETFHVMNNSLGSCSWMVTDRMLFKVVTPVSQQPASFSTHNQPDTKAIYGQQRGEAQPCWNHTDLIGVGRTLTQPQCGLGSPHHMRTNTHKREEQGKKHDQSNRVCKEQTYTCIRLWHLMEGITETDKLLLICH